MQKLRLFVVARSMVVVALVGTGTGWAQVVGGGVKVGANVTMVSGGLGTMTSWAERAADREVPRLKLSATLADSVFHAVQQPGPEKRSWIGRHPALFGALVGFGGGFLIGYLPGDDVIFDDFQASFNGSVLGGVGAGTGAVVGAVVGKATK